MIGALVPLVERRTKKTPTGNGSEGAVAGWRGAGTKGVGAALGEIPVGGTTGTRSCGEVIVARR